MKTIIIALAFTLITSVTYSQKSWELVPSEKSNIVNFTPTENDTTDVKILLKDKLVEGKRISKVIMRVSGSFNGELYYKTLHYLVDGKVVKIDDVLYEKEILSITSSSMWQGVTTPGIIYDSMIDLNFNP